MPDTANTRPDAELTAQALRSAEGVIQEFTGLNLVDPEETKHKVAVALITIGAHVAREVAARMHHGSLTESREEISEGLTEMMDTVWEDGSNFSDEIVNELSLAFGQERLKKRAPDDGGDEDGDLGGGDDEYEEIRSLPR